MDVAPDRSSFCLDRNFLCSHITALKFISEFVILGEGNRIILINWKSKQFLEEENVFQHSSVHAIKTVAGDKMTENIKVLCLGAKSIKIYLFSPNKIKKLDPLCEEQYMDDWIHDAQLSDYNCEDSIITLISAHNCLTFWYWKEKKLIKKRSCSVKCILYSAKIIVQNASVIILVVGTVFQEILIWSPNSDSSSEIKVPLHHLTGHQGVIFSITYSSDLKLLCSTSDDRSLRLWKVNTSVECPDSSLKFWQNANISVIHVLYAHDSRVWMSVILRNCIISIGEDSNICFWNLEGMLLKKEKCHKDGSIWCIDVNSEQDIAATGGSDGGVCLWNLPNALIPVTSCQKIVHCEASAEIDFPRVVCLLSGEEDCRLLVSTDKGILSSYDMKSQEWKNIFQDSSFTSYCIPAVSPNKNFIALANIQGEIVIISSNDLFHSHLEHKKFIAHDGKINNIHWVEEESKYILSCGLKGCMKLWNIVVEETELQLNCVEEFYLLESKRHWWSTTALFSEHGSCLVVGDRSGNINVYSKTSWKEREPNKIQPSMVIKNIHGDNGVTIIKQRNHLMFSAGRDGRVLMYKAFQGRIQLLHSLKVPQNLEWIGGLEFIDDDILFLGFYTTNFMVWSSKYENIMMNIDCGGGHRSWDFSLDGTVRATFAAIKKKEILLSLHDLSFKLKKSSLKVGISGREFSCVLYLFSVSSENQALMSVVAVSGEDNTLKIVGFMNESHASSDLVPLHNLCGHISSIKSIAKCEMLEKNSYLLVSVGGRAQMMIWKIVNDLEITCQELLSDILHSGENKSKKPWKEKNIDANINSQMRYMDVIVFLSQHSSQIDEEYCIATACSDGLFRLHCFIVTGQKLTLTHTICKGDHCLLKLSHFQVEEAMNKSNFFVTGATDGKLQIFQLENFYCNALLKNYSEEPVCESDVLNREITSTVSLHQSGINALDIKHLSEERYLIGTGGDDNSLCIVLVNIQLYSPDSKEKIQVISKASIKSAHSSQITGLKFLGCNTLASISIDQRFNLWNWTIEDACNTINIDLKTSIMSSIPDISHLEVWKNEFSNTFSSVISGEGIEKFCLSEL